MRMLQANKLCPFKFGHSLFERISEKNNNKFLTLTVNFFKSSKTEANHSTARIQKSRPEVSSVSRTRHYDALSDLLASQLERSTQSGLCYSVSRIKHLWPCTGGRFPPLSSFKELRRIGPASIADTLMADRRLIIVKVSVFHLHTWGIMLEVHRRGQQMCQAPCMCWKIPLS